MSFGFSVGDIFMLGSVALRLYFSYKDGPNQYREVCRELLSLHTTLEEIQLDLKDKHSVLSRAEDRKIQALYGVIQRCNEVLQELDNIHKKYVELDCKTNKLSWRRMKFGNEDISSIRSKLTFHLQSIATYLNTFSNASLGRIEERLQALERLEAKVEQILVSQEKHDRRSEIVPNGVMLAPESFNAGFWMDDNATTVEDTNEVVAALEEDGMSKQDVMANKEFITAMILWRDNSNLNALVRHSETPRHQDWSDDYSEEDSTNYPTNERGRKRAQPQPTPQSFGSYLPPEYKPPSVMDQPEEESPPIETHDSMQNIADTELRAEYGLPDPYLCQTDKVELVKNLLAAREAANFYARLELETLNDIQDSLNHGAKPTIDDGLAKAAYWRRQQEDIFARTEEICNNNPKDRSTTPPYPTRDELRCIKGPPTTSSVMVVIQRVPTFKP